MSELSDEKRILPVESQSCCGSALTGASSCGRNSSGHEHIHWISGSVSSPIGPVPRVTTVLRFKDRLGTWKVRWSLGRMRYAIEPGLYAVGNPTSDSTVFVSANYKMSFDRLRSELSGRDAWIMVLDTKGINVWCAAGKGTFGTDEIVNRVKVTRLREVAAHRRLILPQLGAPGVNADKVRRGCGFKVTYGPVRAEDLPGYLDAGMKATSEMRLVRFSFGDRLTLVPVELVQAVIQAIPVVAIFVVLSGMGSDGYSIDRALTVGFRSSLLFFGALLAGGVVAPALLPWLPGRAFASKGAWAGLAVVLAVGWYGWYHPHVLENWFSAIAWFLIIPAVASFVAMNFTGASTYTSLSGVKREMRVAVPLQAGGGLLGMVLWITGRFV